MIRKIVKLTKQFEVVEVRSKRKEKVMPMFEDISGVFTREHLDFENEIVITFALTAFEQKDHMFKLPIKDKIERFTFLKDMATKFYKVTYFRLEG